MKPNRDIFNVTIIGTTHSLGLHKEIFWNVGETIFFGLKALGKQVTFSDKISMDATNILLAAIDLHESMLTRLPESTIIYNFEQLEGADWITRYKPQYVEFMRRFRTWDYSRRNLDSLRSMFGVERAKLVPLGYVPELTRIKSLPALDIDVLFYGSLVPRRMKIIEELRNSGLKAHAAFGLYGAERDRHIARSKVVLNMHHQNAEIFEIARTSYLFSNRKAVVSEANERTEIEPDLSKAALFVPYDGLVEACRRLADDDGLRKHYEEEGFRRFSARDEREILESALAEGERKTPRSRPKGGKRR